MEPLTRVDAPSGNVRKAEVSRRRALTTLVVLWTAVLAVALPALPHRSRGALEALVILAGVALLLANSGFRATVLRAPRAQRYAVGAVLIVWFFSQIREVETATYPLMSWHMYGEPFGNDPIEGWRLQGTDCRGTRRRVPWTGGAMGRRPTMSSGIRRAYRASVEQGPTQAAASAAVDSLLLVVLDAWNVYPGNTPLCRLELQWVSVPAAQASKSPLPAYETVRAVIRP